MVFVCSQGEATAASFSNLADGLLVTGGTPLRSQAASWHVVVVVRSSLDASTILQEINKLEMAISKIIPERVSEIALQDWTSRLEKLRSDLANPGRIQMDEETPFFRRRSRTNRGP